MPMTAQLAAAMKSTLRVLAVEDDARYRGMLLTMLRDLSCEPIAMSSAPEALQWLQAHKADAIVLDLNMPRMDGLAFLQQLRAHDRATPVIILTGVGTLQSAQTAIRLGVSDFLTKPCHLGAMETALDRVRRKLAQAKDHSPTSASPASAGDESPASANERRASLATPAGCGEASASSVATPPATRRMTLAEVERDAILEALRTHGGNRSAAAAALGISRRTMHYRIAEYRQHGWLGASSESGVSGEESDFVADEVEGEADAE